MRFVALALSLLLVPVAASAQDAPSQDAAPGFPFKPGDTVSFDQIDKLKNFLPPEFWEHREYFFYEGMGIEIGETRNYTPADAYMAAGEKYKGKASVGRDGALVGHVAGRPFETLVDCKGDPKAGSKIIWNMMKRWEGDGAETNWSYTYWDRGEQLPLYYEGSAKTVFLSSRVEPQYEETGGDIFKNEKRQNAFGVDVLAPFDARGIIVLQYRYKASDNALDETRNDDTWVYVPDLRRTRRISTAQRTDSVQGTDFTFDDLRSFSGIPPQYTWKCLKEVKVLAPMGSKHLAYPYDNEYNFGPYGFSFANDRWEVRDAYMISFDPRNDDHPYSRKDIYVDKETFEPLYSFAYDRREELWKIIWHTSRWSQDWNGNDPKGKDGVWYEPWEGVDDPKDLRLVSDIIVNVQTGTGNRIESWDSHGTPLSSRGKIRRYIDIGRLNKGR